MNILAYKNEVCDKNDGGEFFFSSLVSVLCIYFKRIRGNKNV
jgi:hypothetical protein